MADYMNDLLPRQQARSLLSHRLSAAMTTAPTTTSRDAASSARSLAGGGVTSGGVTGVNDNQLSAISIGGGSSRRTTAPINIDMQRRLKAVQRERANFPVVSDTGLANEIISIVKENNRGLGRSVGSIITEVKRLHRIPDRTILHEIDLAINRGSLIYPLKGDDNDIVAIPGFIEDVYTYLSSVDFQPVETLVSDLCTYLPIIYPATLYTFDDIVTRVRFLVKLGYLTANSVLEVKLGANINPSLIGRRADSRQYSYRGRGDDI